MARAVTRVQERLSRILLEFYDATGLDDFRARALAAVDREFGGELVCHNELDLGNGGSLSVLSRAVPGFETLRPAFFEHVHDHPSVRLHLGAGGTEPRAVKTSDFVGQRAWRGSGIYREFYRPLADVRYQLTIGQRIDESLVLFAISRRHRDFSEQERALLSLLRPHFICAYRNAKARDALAALQAQARDVRCEVAALMERYRLSRREAEVLAQIVTGKRNAEIAAALGMGRSTVKTRLERIFQRLGVRSRTAAVLRVMNDELAAGAPPAGVGGTAGQDTRLGV